MICLLKLPVCGDCKNNVLYVKMFVNNLQSRKCDVHQVPWILQYTQVHHDEGVTLFFITLYCKMGTYKFIVHELKL